MKHIFIIFDFSSKSLKINIYHTSIHTTFIISSYPSARYTYDLLRINEHINVHQHQSFGNWKDFLQHSKILIEFNSVTSGKFLIYSSRSSSKLGSSITIAFNVSDETLSFCFLYISLYLPKIFPSTTIFVTVFIMFVGFLSKIILTFC